MNRPTGPFVIACVCGLLAAAPTGAEQRIVHSTVASDAHSHAAPAVQPSPHVLTKSKVTVATFSPDGKVLLTVSEDDGQVHFWDATSGEEVNRFGVAVTQAIFSADGSRVLTWGKDKVARVFDTRTGKALRRLEGAKDVRVLAISPNGAVAATCEPARNAITLWDAAAGQPTGTLDGHTVAVTTLAFTPDGRQLLSLSGQPPPDAPPMPQIDPLRLWDVTTRKEVRKIDLPSAASGAYLSNDGKLALVAWSNSNKIYELSTGNVIPAPRTPDEFFPPGQAAGDRKTGLFKALGTASIVNVLTGETVRPLAGPIEGVPMCNAFSADGSKVILGVATAISLRSGETRGKVYVYEVATGKQLAALDGHPREVQRVAFSPDGTRAFSLDATRTLFLWAVLAGAK